MIEILNDNLRKAMADGSLDEVKRRLGDDAVAVFAAVVNELATEAAAQREDDERWEARALQDDAEEAAREERPADYEEAYHSVFGEYPY